MRSSQLLAACSIVATLACGGAPKSALPAAAAPNPARVTALRATPKPTELHDPSDPLAKGLEETAAWFAPNYSVEGGMFRVKLAEKAHAHAEVTLKAGKCWVVVGFAPSGGVADFDTALLSTDGAAIAEDSDDDTTPTIGKPPICPEADATYLLDLSAERGAGDAAFALYAHPR